MWTTPELLHPLCRRTFTFLCAVCVNSSVSEVRSCGDFDIVSVGLVYRILKTKQIVLFTMSYVSNFTVDTGKSILMEIIKTVNQPANSKTISLAKASAGKEMLQMMTTVFPLVMKIQMEVITNFGFPGTREGLVQFEQLIREIEREDAEISRLRSQIRAIYLPPIVINPVNDVLI